MQGIGVEESDDETNAAFVNEMTDMVSLEFIRQIGIRPGWSVECGGTHVAFWTDRVFRPQDRMTRVDEVDRLMTTLERGDQQQGTMRLVASGAGAPQEMSMSFSGMGTSGIGWPIGGAIGGMFGSFAIFGVVFFTLIDKAPWIVFLWPFFGMACMVGGFVLGMKIRNARQ